MSKEKICANCTNWRPDNQVKGSIFGLPQLNPEKRDNQYGKCQVQFTGSDGKLNRFDSGAIGSTACFAKDDNGKLLFTPKVQGETPTTS